MNRDHKDGVDGNYHARFRLQYHLVLATKYRRKALTDDILQTFRIVTEELFERNGCQIVALNHDLDHLHLMFSATPEIQLSKLICTLKTMTSKRIRKAHAVWLKQFYWKPVFWSRSYYIGSVGDTTAEVVELYIHNQGKEK